MTETEIRGKFANVFYLAKTLLERNGNTKLAFVAENASLVHNLDDPTRVAVVHSDSLGILPSWPLDYLSAETVAKSELELAEAYIGVLKQLDELGKVN